MNWSLELKWWRQRVVNIWHFVRSLFWVIYNGYPARKLTVIGVTGTDGKTTTSTLIYEILQAAGYKTGLITTVNAKVGDEELETGLHTTNPDAQHLQPILKKMVEKGVTHVVLEVTAHGLDQYRVLGCNFYIGVLTNISHEHLDDFVTMENYARAKAKLFRNVRYAVVNRDDEYKDWILRATQDDTKIIEYGKSEIKEVSEALRGEYNRYNIGAALMVADVLGIKYQVSSIVVKNFKGVVGRREEVKSNKGFKVYVDFAHTPNGLKSILTQLRTETKNKLIVVFGCTGERDQTKRPIMGKIVSEIADNVIITSDDTRHESQDKIYDQIVSSIKYEVSSMKKVTKENDRKKAIEMAIKMAKNGDIVLLAGKGHEKSINLGGVEHPWSDVSTARDIINHA
ncbi:MAG: UDP-N-acetylmuramoyl-L-alanyl-D-glutamate--2,6-diaminopimelate ligase [Patescibacteria group bacterium]